MSDDPPRLLSGPLSPQARELLESAAHDGLDAAQESRIRAGLGLAPAPHALTGLQASQATTASQASVRSWLQWALVTGGIGAAALWAFSERQSELSAPPVAPALNGRAPSEPPASSSGRSVSSVPSQLAVPSAQPSASPLPVKAEVQVVRGRGDSSLADELALLDQARRAVADGRAATALEVLKTHARKFPRGALRDEAAVLRMEAYVLAGDRDRARTSAEAFLERAPDSPQRARVRSLLERLQ